MRAGIILFALMAGLCELPQLEIDQASEEREAALDHELKDWESTKTGRPLVGTGCLGLPWS